MVLHSPFIPGPSKNSQRVYLLENEKELNKRTNERMNERMSPWGRGFTVEEKAVLASLGKVTLRGKPPLEVGVTDKWDQRTDREGGSECRKRHGHHWERRKGAGCLTKEEMVSCFKGCRDQRGWEQGKVSGSDHWRVISVEGALLAQGGRQASRAREKRARSTRLGGRACPQTMVHSEGLWALSQTLMRCFRCIFVQKKRAKFWEAM